MISTTFSATSISLSQSKSSVFTKDIITLYLPTFVTLSVSNEFGFVDEYVIEDVVFILNIGKNIEVVDYVVMDEYYPHINEDGSITFYHPVVNINCSEENEHFYSKDGKLYDKKTNALINEFEYAS